MRADRVRDGGRACRHRRAGAERRPPGRGPADVRQLDLAVPRPGRPAARRRRAHRRHHRPRRRHRGLCRRRQRHLLRDDREPRLHDRRSRRPRPDRARGGCAADRRLDARHAAAVPAPRARRARGAALRDEVPERPPRRARRRHLRRRRRSASDSQPADRHRRRGRARHGLAAAPGHAHAGAAHGAPVRERAGDRRLAREPRRCGVGALSRPAVAPAARPRRPPAGGWLRRCPGVRGRGWPRRRRGAS